MEMNRRTAYRLVALLLLLVMSGDVIACEFISHDHFESFRMPGNDMRLHQSHDHCICCCTHYVVAAAVAVPKPANFLETVALTELEPAMRTPAAVYHPPKV
jgi:hypothetical protein